MKKCLLIALLPLLLASCNDQGKKEEYLASWNQEAASLKTLREYIEDVTDEKSRNFIPKEDRIATFDMDGTFYGELYPTYLEYWMLKYRALEDETYDAPDDVKEAGQAIEDYVKEGKSLPSGFELIHANMAAKAYAGMTINEFDAYVKEYLKTPIDGFKGLTYGEGFYQPMLEVFDYLKANDFDFYVVSGSDRYICRSLVCDSLDIPVDRVIGMDVELHGKDQGEVANVNYTYSYGEDVVRGEELLIKNLKMNKVMNIIQEIGKQPVLSFGNSGGDSAMHNYALTGNKYRSAAFMLVADDNERDYAKKRGEDDAAFQSRIDKLNTDWTNAKYNVISMKDDFKTIYKVGAEKTSFDW